MKERLLWIAVVIAASAGFYFAMVKPALEPPRSPVTIESLKKLRPPPPLPPPELPRPIITEPVIPPPVIKPMALPVVQTPAPAQRPKPLEVPIQNGATIDFSYGAPQIKLQGKDAEALDQALKEIAEVNKDRVIRPAPTNK